MYLEKWKSIRYKILIKKKRILFSFSSKNKNKFYFIKLIILFFLKIYSKKNQEPKHYNYQIIFKFHNEKILKIIKICIYIVYIYIYIGKMLINIMLINVNKMYIKDLLFSIFLADLISYISI